MGVVPQTENYPWLWTRKVPGSTRALACRHRRASPTASPPWKLPVDEARRPPHATGACAPLQSGAGIKIDVAFRVIADHIRTLSFSIADGILPGNNDRNYVLRRILRRAVRYGRTLGFHEPFFYKLVEVLAETMGGVFPELRARNNRMSRK